MEVIGAILVGAGLLVGTAAVNTRARCAADDKARGFTIAICAVAVLIGLCMLAGPEPGQ